jgi:hypothetical protein
VASQILLRRLLILRRRTRRFLTYSNKHQYPNPPYPFQIPSPAHYRCLTCCLILSRAFWTPWSCRSTSCSGTSRHIRLHPHLPTRMSQLPCPREGTLRRTTPFHPATLAFHRPSQPTSPLPCGMFRPTISLVSIPGPVHTVDIAHTALGYSMLDFVGGTSSSSSSYFPSLDSSIFSTPSPWTGAADYSTTTSSLQVPSVALSATMTKVPPQANAMVGSSVAGGFSRHLSPSATASPVIPQPTCQGAMTMSHPHANIMAKTAAGTFTGNPSSYPIPYPFVPRQTVASSGRFATTFPSAPEAASYLKDNMRQQASDEYPSEGPAAERNLVRNGVQRRTVGPFARSSSSFESVANTISLQPSESSESDMDTESSAEASCRSVSLLIFTPMYRH